jgi:hypothetical protein
MGNNKRACDDLMGRFLDGRQTGTYWNRDPVDNLSKSETSRKHKLTIGRNVKVLGR